MKHWHELYKDKKNYVSGRGIELMNEITDFSILVTIIGTSSFPPHVKHDLSLYDY